PPRQVVRDGGQAKKPDAGEASPRKDLHGDPLPPGAVVRLGTVRLRHGGHVTTAVFAPDGKAVATISNDGIAWVWDSSTGKEICRLRPSAFRFNALAYTAAGRAVVLGGSADGYRLLDVSTGHPAGELIRVGKATATAGLGPDGKFAVTVDRDGTARLWDAATAREGRRLATGHPREVETRHLSPNRRIPASMHRHP